MVYYSDSDIVIRNMNYSDVPFIVISEIEQGEQVAHEKYLCRLNDQEKGKNIALVAEYKDVTAEYKGVIAGYVNVYPYSHNGPFIEESYSEIVDLKVLGKNKDLGIEKKLVDVAEKIISEYSDTVYVSVGLHDGHVLRMFVKRGYIPDGSGVWYKNKICPRNSDCKNNDELILWLYKRLILTNIHKFPIFNTPEYPFLRWFEDGEKTVDARVNYGKYTRIQTDDNIIFVDVKNNDFIRGIVTFKNEYSTIEEMLKCEGVKSMLPFLEDDDIEKGVLFLKQLPGWERVKKYGCVAFGIEVTESKF